MAFPERLLAEGEEVVYDLRPHWWTLVGPGLVAALAVAAAVAAALAMPAGALQAAGRLLVAGIALVVVAAAVGLAWAVTPAGSLQAPARLVVGLVGLVVLAVLVAGRVLRWLTTHFVLTTDRVIFRSGLIGRYGREIPLERINDVTFSQSLLERLLGAGDLLIESAGEHGQSTFENVRHPHAVQLEIYRQMEDNGRRRAHAHLEAQAPPADQPRPPSVLDDLERLADLRDRGAVTEEEFQRKKRELLDRL